jgi:hypothetical protein
MFASCVFRDRDPCVDTVCAISQPILLASNLGAGTWAGSSVAEARSDEGLGVSYEGLGVTQKLLGQFENPPGSDRSRRRAKPAQFEPTDAWRPVDRTLLSHIARSCELRRERRTAVLRAGAKFCNEAYAINEA